MLGFIGPLSLIVILLLQNYSVMSTAYWAIIFLVLISFCRPKDLRPKLKDLIIGIIDAGRQGAKLGVILSSIGMVMVSFSGSGLAVKIGSGIDKFSGGSTFIVLLITWTMCMLFGMIGVALVAYYMSAAFAAPLLLGIGLSLEVTHFFLIFPVVFAVITPPVAIACIVASNLAEADFWKTSIETMKAAFVGFFMPFLIIYVPSITLQTGINPITFWIELGLSTLFVISASLGVTGYFKTDMNLIERTLFLCGAIGIIFFLINRTPISIIISLLILITAIISNMMRQKKELV